MSGFNKYFLLTFGCQMNEYDSEVISAAVESVGMLPVEDERCADAIILNTCCVRDKADQKVYGRLGRYRELKEKNPNLVIAVCGCLAQKDGVNLKRRFPHIDLIIGTHNMAELVSLLEEARAGCSSVRVDGVERVNGPDRVNGEPAEFLSPAVRKGGVSAYIPVSVGCDCFCSYCIVPYVRGRLVSRPFDEIIAEAQRLAGNGFPEIFLIGQNVNTYGFDLPGKPSFSALLKELNKIDGLRRIRFTSPHPKDFPPELTEAIGCLDKVCESIHLPLQAGSDSVLKRMNRRYNTEIYMKTVEEIRKNIPGAAVSTDLIVGFPGETEEEFEEGLEFIKKVSFNRAFMFAYSIREGTVAAKMSGHLPHEVRMERLNRLITMQNGITRSKHEENEGKIIEVLVESVSKKDNGKITGRTRTNEVVNFSGDKTMIGEFLNVRLLKGFTWGYLGEKV